MKLRVCLCVLAVVMMVVVWSTVAQADGRILFASDRGGSSDLDIWKTNEDGSSFWQMSSETPAEAHNPSIGRDGKYFIYDVDGVLYLNNLPGTLGSIITLTGSASEIDECYLGNGGSPDIGDSECTDAHAGPLVDPDPPTETQKDYLIVFHRRYVYQTSPNVAYAHEIVMATLDISEGELIDPVSLTPDLTPTHGFQQHPEFCGDDDFIWSRQSDGQHDYFGEICHQEFDEYGPVGDETCWGDNDGLEDLRPSCSSGGRYVVWQKQQSGYGVHDIWLWNTRLSGDPVNLIDHPSHPESFDEVEPNWGPGDVQIIYARSDNNSDYDLYKLNVDGSGDPDPLPSNTDEDREPNWGSQASE